MTRWISEGTCNICKGSFSKTGMTRHLLACKRKNVIPALSGEGKLRKTQLFHLVVSGRYAKDYWMHLEIPTDATLGDLDSFLREIWLECCWHLSAFEISGRRYDSYDSEDWYFDEMDSEKMDVPLSRVLRTGTTFEHEYDFGSTTYLALKVVAEREGQARGKSVQVLARNDPPPIACDVCGELATQLCTMCLYKGEGCLCDECAEEHECGDEMFLPVVNSPRVGVCGYTG